jgi:hypothetical protein
MSFSRYQVVQNAATPVTVSRQFKVRGSDATGEPVEASRFEIKNRSMLVVKNEAKRAVEWTAWRPDCPPALPTTGLNQETTQLHDLRPS